MRAHLSLLVTLCVSASLGCGTVSIGRGPTDLDLKNDGSPAEQQALQKKYALAYESFSLKRPGASAEEVSAEIQERVSEVRSPAWSDEAEDYLATSARAEDTMDTAPVGFDRFAHGPVPTTMLFVGSVLVGSGLGMASAVNVGRVDGGTVADVSWGALNGAVGGVLFSLPLMIVYQLTIPLLSSSIASADYKRSVRAFNADLEARILKHAAPPAAPAPPPEPAPAPPAAEPASATSPNPAPEGTAAPTPIEPPPAEHKPDLVP